MRDSPGSSQTRSHGSTRKSPVIAAWTWGWRRISAVGVFCDRSFGERISGLGNGREVRCGFWASAVSIALTDEGGVMSWMSLGMISFIC